MYTRLAAAAAVPCLVVLGTLLIVFNIQDGESEMPLADLGWAAPKEKAN